MIRLARRLLGLQPPPVSKAEATEIARAECVRRGWPWQEPVLVKERLREYTFWTNADMRGGNVFIRVNAQNGGVTWSSITPR